jgi:hypothetical protein
LGFDQFVLDFDRLIRAFGLIRGSGVVHKTPRSSARRRTRLVYLLYTGWQTYEHLYVLSTPHRLLNIGLIIAFPVDSAGGWD